MRPPEVIIQWIGANQSCAHLLEELSVDARRHQCLAQVEQRLARLLQGLSVLEQGQRRLSHVDAGL